MKMTGSQNKKPISRARILKMLETHRTEIRKFDVRFIGLFGSFVRRQAKLASDIDILVEFERPTFDKYMDLKFLLEDLFGRKVDLVLRNALKPGLREIILNEVVYAPGF